MNGVIMDSEVKPKSFYIFVKKYCPRRSLEASKNFQYFIQNGLNPIDDPKKADLIIIHTCGGFKSDEERSIQTLKKVLKIKSAKVIVTGCLPKINPAKLENFNNVLILATEELGKLDSLIEAKVNYINVSDSPIIYGINDLYRGSLFSRIRRHFGFNTTFLKLCVNYIRQELQKPKDPYFAQETCKIEIAKGCMGDCSYCAIKLAMPIFHSVPEAQIIEKFKFGLKQNYKNFDLIAGDIGSYGLDIQTSFPSLLKKLFKIRGDYKIRLLGLNARWLVKYYQDLFPIFKDNANRTSEIMIPIQSGSNRILRLMRRHYTIDEVKKCLLDLQKEIPSIKLETHLLVGFPGETDDDFQMSINLLREVTFSKVWVYKYDDRPGTAAFKLPNKVSKEIINNRAKILEKEFNAEIINES